MNTGRTPSFDKDKAQTRSSMGGVHTSGKGQERKHGSNLEGERGCKKDVVTEDKKFEARSSYAGATPSRNRVVIAEGRLSDAGATPSHDRVTAEERWSDTDSNRTLPADIDSESMEADHLTERRDSSREQNAYDVLLKNRTSASTSTSKASGSKATEPPTNYGRRSERDTDMYRQGYPGKHAKPNANYNFLFYTNQMKSKPRGDYIDTIHKKWFGNYDLLERHHGFIQWLFPIREQGLNWDAQELQPHEAEKIKADRKARMRVLKSYKLMLDFYGMAIMESTGEVSRAKNWKPRFKHLNRSYHNYLRITRILKSLGELGFEHYQFPFVKFVLVEAIKEKTLDNVHDSCINFWLPCVKSDKEREKLYCQGEALVERYPLAAKCWYN